MAAPRPVPVLPAGGRVPRIGEDGTTCERGFTMVRDRIDQIERRIARLRPDDIRRLAAAYREWQDVLSGALDAVPPRSVRALAPMNERLRQGILAAAADEVGPLDIEDALMAAWLALLAATDSDDRAVTALLAGPWRRVAQAVDQRDSRTQADRVTFAAPA